MDTMMTDPTQDIEESLEASVTPRSFFSAFVHKNKRVLSTLAAFLLILVAGVLALAWYKGTAFQNAGAFIPEKTEFNGVTPPGLLAEIPIEKGAILSQSYIKEYQNQTQMSVVFPSQKTLSENYALYETFLRSEGWEVVRNLQGEKRSSLYGTKENYRIDITIINGRVSGTLATTTVSAAESYILISLLKKNMN